MPTGSNKNGASAIGMRLSRVGVNWTLPSRHAQGMFRQAQPKRATAGALVARDRLEVRSFEVDHVCALWHLDFDHGSRRVLTRQGLTTDDSHQRV